MSCVRDRRSSVAGIADSLASAGATLHGSVTEWESSPPWPLTSHYSRKIEVLIGVITLKKEDKGDILLQVRGATDRCVSYPTATPPVVTVTTTTTTTRPRRAAGEKCTYTSNTMRARLRGSSRLATFSWP
jgi:hypothetical protein